MHTKKVGRRAVSYTLVYQIILCGGKSIVTRCEFTLIDKFIKIVSISAYTILKV